jgi:GT2 family glycosyltransferase
MYKKPLVTLLVLNWNGSQTLFECLDSLANTNYRPLEIIVVDNCSTDDSDSIAANFPYCHLIKSSTNLGYAEGNNFGISKSNGKYIATLNNDIVVDPNWLTWPIELLERDERIGIISCRQMQFDDRDRIDALYSYPPKSLMFSPSTKEGQVLQNVHSFPGFVIGANGASAIYRKTTLNELKGFDKRFFAYHEESDLCMRAFLRGWKCVYSPLSIVYHHGSHSFGKRSKQQYYLHERNRLLFLFKNFPSHMLWRALPAILLMEIRLLRVIALIENKGITYLQARRNAFKAMSLFKYDRKLNLSYFTPVKRKAFYTFMHQKIIRL